MNLLPSPGTTERTILDEIDESESSYNDALRARPTGQHDDPWAEDYLPERHAPGDSSADEQWVSFNPPWLY